MKQILEYIKNNSKGNNNSPFIISDNITISYSEFYNELQIRKEKYKFLRSLPTKNIGIQYEISIEFIYTFFVLISLNLTPVLFNTRLTSKETLNLLEYSDCSYIFSNFDTNFQIGNLNNYEQIDNSIILFTSGTTSAAKGVIQSQDSLINSAIKFSNYFNSTSEELYIASLPFFHIGGLMLIIRAVVNGAAIYIPNSLKISDLLKGLDLQKDCYLSVVPTQLQDLINNNTYSKYLKAVIVGGASTPVNLTIDSLKQNIPLYKVYGSSETCSMVSIANSVELKEFPMCSGRAFNDNYINISDEGEVIVKSDTLFTAYYKQKEETNRKLLNGNYYTGDFGYLSNGLLFLQNRREDLIISGGENINPFEIENLILQIEGIKEVCVIGKKDEKWGHVPVAFIVSDNVTELQIKEHIKPKIAQFKQPKHYYFLDSLPLNHVGKIDKKKLTYLIES